MFGGLPNSGELTLPAPGPPDGHGQQGDADHRDDRAGHDGREEVQEAVEHAGEQEPDHPGNQDGAEDVLQADHAAAGVAADGQHGCDGGE